MASEFGFRPCKIEDLKGQPKVQKMLQIYIKAAQIKKNLSRTRLSQAKLDAARQLQPM